MDAVRGKVAVVTGAGGGIGRALAIALSRRGAHVAGCDVNETALEETNSLCGGGMLTQLVDVSNESQIHQFAADVVAGFGAVNQIYNNAGIALSTPVLGSTAQDYRRVLGINLDGVIYGTLAFLPHILASGDGHVVNVSSANGYYAQPKLSHYCAAKYGVRGFTECLRAEMLLEKLPVKVSVVHPGGVATGIASNALEVASKAGRTVTAADRARAQTYATKLLVMKPERAAEIIIRGVERGKPRIRVGRDAIMADLISRLIPAGAIPLAVASERSLLDNEQT